MFGRRGYFSPAQSIVQQQAQPPQLRSYSKKKETTPLLSTPNQGSSGVQGINSVVSTMTLCQSGLGDQLCSINLSTQPGQKKRLLSVTGAQTFLVNYAESQYPSRICIGVDQLGGMSDKSGNSLKVTAVLVPSGAAVPVYNAGGVIGYNVAYKMLGQPIAWDISNLPVLTWKVWIGSALQPAVYPIAQPITFNVQITRVMF